MADQHELDGMSLNLLEGRIKRQADIAKRSRLLEKGILDTESSISPTDKIDDLPSPLLKRQF